jgi:hypothetical protein
VQDVLATVMVVAESRDRAHLTACMDTTGWLAQISYTAISFGTLLDGTPAAQVAIIAAVSAANYAGTYAGTRIGHRLTRQEGS